MLKEPTRRIRFLTHEEARKLLAELPAHLADMTFSLSTGLRAANVTGLQWSQVDEERKLCWVHPDQAKARKAIAVPLNGEALAIVQRQKGLRPTPHPRQLRGQLPTACYSQEALRSHKPVSPQRQHQTGGVSCASGSRWRCYQM
jgi:integrase